MQKVIIKISNFINNIKNFFFKKKNIEENNIKYLFPENDQSFKNFGKNETEYSTLIHHHENFLESIKKFLSNENIDKTKYFINSLSSFYKEMSDFYLKLLSFDEILLDKVKHLITNDTNTLVSLVVWGEEYSKKFCNLALYSLEEDINEINKKYKTKIVLFVDNNSKKILEKNETLKILISKGTVIIINIPSDIFDLDYFSKRISITRYFVFGFIQNICWRHCAKNNINLSFLTPDNFYSSKFLFNLIKRINQKDELFAIFSNSSLKVNLNQSADLDLLAKKLKKMDLNQLFEFFKKNIHISFYNYFISPGKKIEQNSPMYFLNNSKYMSIYSLHSHPYIINKRYLKKFENFRTFLPIDESFPIQSKFDIKFFEKNVDLESGLCIDFSEYIENKSTLVEFSNDEIKEYFEKFKNNELKMWLLKNPIKLNHNKFSNLIFKLTKNLDGTQINSTLDLKNKLETRFKDLIKNI